MTRLSPTLRKAAVLISALDDRSADALLEQMGPEQAAKVRSALAALDEIPPAEQEAVLAEFLRQQAPGGPAGTDNAADVSLELHSAGEPPAARPATASPLAFLRDVAPQHLARVLKSEQAQTIAAVIANLPPEQAAVLLEQLPAALATDAVERLAWLDELPPEVVADLAHSLRQRLRPYLGSSGQAARHQTAVLQAMQARQRQRGGEPATPRQPTVIAQRYRLEPAATTVQPPALPAFSDLAQLADGALRQVFAEADPQLALLALTGAEERLVGRILRQLPPREAALLRQRLEHPGPIRLREIEQARQALAALAGRLAAAGEIAWPPRAGFAAAV